MAIPKFHQKQWMSQETPSKKKEERIQKKKISQEDDFNSNGGRS